MWILAQIYRSWHNSEVFDLVFRSHDFGPFDSLSQSRACLHDESGHIYPGGLTQGSVQETVKMKEKKKVGVKRGLLPHTDQITSQFQQIVLGAVLL